MSESMSWLARPRVLTSSALSSSLCSSGGRPNTNRSWQRDALARTTAAAAAAAAGGCEESLPLPSPHIHTETKTQTSSPPPLGLTSIALSSSFCSSGGKPNTNRSWQRDALAGPLLLPLLPSLSPTSLAALLLLLLLAAASLLLLLSLSVRSSLLIRAYLNGGGGGGVRLLVVAQGE